MYCFLSVYQFFYMFFIKNDDDDDDDVDAAAVVVDDDGGETNVRTFRGPRGFLWFVLLFYIVWSLSHVNNDFDNFQCFR